MANLKEVRERITSVKNTQQITKAMKMVSAAKLRRAQQAITQMRPYANKLNEILKNILSNLDGDVASAFGEERMANKVCMVVVTSSRGLCGGFNTNIVKAATKKINSQYKSQLESGNLDIIFIGKKGFDSMKRLFPQANFNTDNLELFGDLSFDNVSAVSQLLMDKFEAKVYDRIDVAYASFKNAALQEHECVQFLPVEKVEAVADDSSKIKSDYIFEPSTSELLDYLVPSILQTTFQKFLLDTHASEHGARMTAMDNATENAQELLQDLKISYNKARQEAITRELSEIVGGAAALESA
ncbi:MAG: ATP synthase F1 subunit gamma [Saprospiraceae bacterium]|nr:ATP synthase F1 subunit gamma [Saprospiraceae bacterium]